MSEHTPMEKRFRGFLPVVVDVETGGFNEQTDALLQVAAVILDMQHDGKLSCAETHSCHVNPFEGASSTTLSQSSKWQRPAILAVCSRRGARTQVTTRGAVVGRLLRLRRRLRGLAPRARGVR